MSLTSTSFRAIACASRIGGAPALFIGASRLSRAIFHLPSRSSFSKAVRQEGLQAGTVSQRLLAHRMRQPHQLQQTFARQMHRQRPRRLQMVVYTSRVPDQPERTNFWEDAHRIFWEEFHHMFWPCFFGFILEVLYGSSEAESSGEMNRSQDESENDVGEELGEFDSRLDPHLNPGYARNYAGQTTRNPTHALRKASALAGTKGVASDDSCARPKLSRPTNDNLLHNQSRLQYLF
ncbi:hypothetical protein C7974DRAFT_446602 [Boeremia exigua]|uniref:uncharacterized protein n=1 Tax=Boeremia exigua TaxID=749465 RepID=UPI001E8DE47B|nr:uncharacterized protein C7974DRAFT_446602 [Boeremia exigua]KAH6642201.1 hypothetical protein C7974DRAFT_446602 [Boeremia exigua]